MTKTRQTQPNQPIIKPTGTSTELVFASCYLWCSWSHLHERSTSSTKLYRTEKLSVWDNTCLLQVLDQWTAKHWFQTSVQLWKSLEGKHLFERCAMLPLEWSGILFTFFPQSFPQKTQNQRVALPCPCPHPCSLHYLQQGCNQMMPHHQPRPHHQRYLKTVTVSFG